MFTSVHYVKHNSLKVHSISLHVYLGGCDGNLMVRDKDIDGCCLFIGVSIYIQKHNFFLVNCDHTKYANKIGIYSTLNV